MERAAVVTAPLSNPMTRAGQHQAPIKAGMEANNVTIEIMSPHLSRAAFCFSSSTGASLIALFRSGAFTSDFGAGIGRDQAPSTHSFSSSVSGGRVPFSFTSIPILS